METGIDILEISRIRKILKRNSRNFVKRVYTHTEIENMPVDSPVFYSLNFSFKEAVWKTLSPSLQKKTYFRDIEIVWKRGTPEPRLFGKKIKNIAVGFRHCGDTVVTAAVLLTARDSRTARNSCHRKLSALE